jgi:hypothetical protein
VLLATEQTEAEEMFDRLTESGRCYVTEMNVGKPKVKRIARHPSPVQIMTDQKQLENVEYFDCLGSMITNDAVCTREIKCDLAMAKVAQNKEKAFFNRKLYFNIRTKTVNCYIWSTAFYGAETWTLRQIRRGIFYK